jgi:hypothetical protein
MSYFGILLLAFDVLLPILLIVAIMLHFERVIIMITNYDQMITLYQVNCLLANHDIDGIKDVSTGSCFYDDFNVTRIDQKFNLVDVRQWLGY